MRSLAATCNNNHPTIVAADGGSSGDVHVFDGRMPRGYNELDGVESGIGALPFTTRLIDETFKSTSLHHKQLAGDTVIMRPRETLWACWKVLGVLLELWR